MSNVITMERTQEQLDRLAFTSQGYGDADFDVNFMPIYLADGQRIPKKFASVRADTDTILNIHSSTYKPVDHRQMIDNQRAVIIRSGLADNSIKEEISIDKTGKKCFVKHTLPNHIVEAPCGDTAALTLLSTNSYCGTWAYMISAGAKLGACQNNQVFTSGAAALYKSKHNRHLDVDHGGDILTKALPVFLNQNKLWHEWHGISCSDMQAALIFAKTINKPEIARIFKAAENRARVNMDSFNLRNDYMDSVFGEKEVYGCRAFMYLWHRWTGHYADVLGGNLWGVYNTLTDWATHIQSKAVSVASVQQRRSTAIQKTLDSDWSGFKIAA